MITMEVLGGLRVFRDGEELTALPGKPKRAALLSLIAVDRDVSREQLCFLLWPDSDASGARHALSQTLLELKRELGESWLDARPDRIVATPDLDVDLLALRDAAGHEGRSRDVIEHYRGPFLEGVQLSGSVEFERWIENNRAEVHRSVREAFHAATASTAEADERVRLTRAWVELDPLWDDAQHALIESLAAAGQRTAALEQYEQYARLIEAELEVEPLDHTKDLVELIKRGDVPALTAPATAQSLLGPDLQIVRALRRGATGAVFLAREPALRRNVAVKVLHADVAQHATDVERFRREVQSAGRILHPNVATVFRVGMTNEEEPRPFSVLPYIEGVTLKERLEARGPLGPVEVARILSEVASALAVVHKERVVHRDIRPDNILYEEETGRTYVIDFGIAGSLDWENERTRQLTMTGEVLGNPDFMSPEQQRGAKLTDRSDVFSLGVTGFKLLLGPGDGGKPGEQLVRRDEAYGRLAADHAELVDLLRRATADDPNHRPSAADLADSFSAIAAKHPERGGFVEDLRKRRMVQFVATYFAGALAGMGAVDQLVQQGLLEPIWYRLALAFSVAGLFATSITAWYHGERGRQRVSATELVLLSAVFVAWVAVTVLLLG